MKSFSYLHHEPFDITINYTSYDHQTAAVNLISFGQPHCTRGGPNKIYI